MIAAHTPVSTHPSYNESDYRNTITIPTPLRVILAGCRKW